VTRTKKLPFRRDMISLWRKQWWESSKCKPY